MPRRHPFGLFYQAGPDFNYLKYQEERSHFDRLGKSVDLSVHRGIRELVLSNEDLARQNIKTGKQIQGSIEASGRAIESSIQESSKQLQSVMSEGFETLSIDIKDVRASIDEMAAICEIGFSYIALELTNINQSIDQLIKISKSPEQTWALEQFDIARDAFRRHLYAESLEYIDRAIFGFDGHSGYKLDYRFHILRGNIHLGNERNFDPEVVDPTKAVEDFLNAARYAEHEDLKGFAESYQLAGWSYYCCNKIEESEKAIKKSLEIKFDDSFTQFLAAKVLLHQDRVPEAIKYFEKCIRNNLQLILRAGADPDFLDHYPDVVACVDAYRRELVNGVRLVADCANLPLLQTKWGVVLRHSDVPDGGMVNELRGSVERLDDAPIKPLKALREQISDRINTVIGWVENTKNRIDAEIIEISNNNRKKYKEFEFGEMADNYDRHNHAVKIAISIWIGGFALLGLSGSDGLAGFWFVIIGPTGVFLAGRLASESKRRSQELVDYTRSRGEFEAEQDRLEKERVQRLGILKEDVALL